MKYSLIQLILPNKLLDILRRESKRENVSVIAYLHTLVVLGLGVKMRQAVEQQAQAAKAEDEGEAKRVHELLCLHFAEDRNHERRIV